MSVLSYMRNIMIGAGLVIAILSPSISPASMHLQYSEASASEDSMKEMKLILKKLRNSMSSMKDFDELEEAGLPKKDVNRMRRAMTQKIHQLTDEVVSSIRTL